MDLGKHHVSQKFSISNWSMLMNIGSWGGGEGMGIPIPSPEGNKGEAKRMLRSVGSTVSIQSGDMASQL